MALPAKGWQGFSANHRKLGERHETDSLWALRRNPPHWYLDRWLPASRAVRGYILYSSFSVCGTCSDSPRKQLRLIHGVKTVPGSPSSQDKTEPSPGALRSQQMALPSSHDGDFLDSLWPEDSVRNKSLLSFSYIQPLPTPVKKALPIRSHPGSRSQSHLWFLLRPHILSPVSCHLSLLHVSPLSLSPLHSWCYHPLQASIISCLDCYNSLFFYD